MRVLVLGGTGAIGQHACKELASLGCDVVVTSRRPRESEDESISYVVGSAKDKEFLYPLLGQEWDAILDFMVWHTHDFSVHRDAFLDATAQYVFTSSYRVYADASVITEDTPRLLDTIDDKAYLATDEYALAKARCENLLVESGRTNWTVLRPSVTYDGAAGRLQLGVLEARDWLWRAVNGIPVPFPREMFDKQTTMTYGLDAARMIARLVGNPQALGECFTVASSDHMSWRDVIDVYRSAYSFDVVECSCDKFEKARGGVYQIRYDRMYNRRVDNSKALRACRMSQDELTPMGQGLVEQLEECMRLNLPLGQPRVAANARLDRLTGGAPSLSALTKGSSNSLTTSLKYLVRRLYG